MTDIVERLRSSSPYLHGSSAERTMADAADEIGRLTNAIRRIDGINDNPANYNPAINAVCDAILRAALEPKP